MPPRADDRMTKNYSWHAPRVAATMFACTLLIVLTTAQSQICVGQELPAPANAAPEPLPPSDAAQLNGPTLKDCEPAPTDNPLFTLNVDISPRTSDGKLVANDQLPTNCAKMKLVQPQAMSIDLSCDTCYPGHCDILSLARFCHKPLYFNDDCLERCGVEQCCCQPCRSALCFYGGALLMPVRACFVCPCSCVQSGGCCR